ncbi:PREDICTED: uncharacterized protein LOC105560503 [Vollenhovia emeryi]|uniref:uncharacterized protein LOC105560503 n=1 Tax=Vollenhovia emeryi TaxID=411798 RepID=UPI0005F57579|nr:PREDICTED: uncharacterized protein LOC105560503 [Vollenhovia emeryi]
MESKTSNQDHIEYNEFFYATVCHVCKRFGDDVPLKRCSGCKLISYCSKEHQKQHWKQHKSLCNTVLNATRTRNINEYCGTALEWYNEKTSYMQLVSAKLRRPLQMYESDMFMHPKECVVCYEVNGHLLKDCKDCAAYYCKDHIDDIEHKNICVALGLDYRIRLQRMIGKSFLDLNYVAYVSKADTFENMKEFIKTYPNIQSHSELSCDIQEAVHSQYVTQPLTLFNAMQLLEYVPDRKDLVIHVVGANKVEETTLAGWGVLLNLINISSLMIVMVGPELNCKSYTLPDGLFPQKECSFEFHDSLYENYAYSSSFVKPDIIIGFNACIQEYKFRSPEDTWTAAIRLIAKKNCPFILTCDYTQEHVEYEAERINTILNRQIDCLYSGKNPFTSLRPYRVAMSQKVSYANHYVIIYKSLCR